jgi:hypothetical protein
VPTTNPRSCHKATAYLPLANFFAALQAVVDWLAGSPAPAPAQPAREPVRPQHPARVTRRPMAVPRAPKPLRVVRVVEPAGARNHAGRMVISGRLADVCAELDRLVALEARGH